jgi:hypothetical protein
MVVFIVQQIATKENTRAKRHDQCRGRRDQPPEGAVIAGGLLPVRQYVLSSLQKL